MEMLERAGVRRVTAEEAHGLCGVRESGLWLPYRTMAGNAVQDGGRPYGRLRLDRPQDGKKYHQAAGSAVHAYVTPSSQPWGRGATVFLVEGEFKALALRDFGLVAVGLSGFFGFALKGGEVLTAELTDVLEAVQPERIYFIGDTDTAVNYQFSVAAVRLAEKMGAVQVLLPRLPLDSPGKGVDDCREVLGEGFGPWWGKLLEEAVPVEAGVAAAALAVELLSRERAAVGKLNRSGQALVEKRLVQMGAVFEDQPLAQDRVSEFAVKALGVGKSAFRKAVRGVVSEQKRATAWEAVSVGDEDDGTICLSRSAADWTRQVCKAVANDTYRYAGNLCRWFEEKLYPQSAAEIVSFVDNAERCIFSQRGKEGNVPATFTEAHARLFLGSWMNNMDLLRQVEVVSPSPVLAWDGEQAVLVNDYCPKTRILATGGKLELPSVAEAVELLTGLLRDYDLPTLGDWGRALALVMTPALAQGGFLGKGRAPLFLVRKNKHQAGGSLLLRLVAGIYGWEPKPVPQSERPERMMEDLSRMLLAGTGYIYFDNVRGDLMKRLPWLESLLTEPKFSCRAPYLHGEADVTRRVLAVSSNGSTFSGDLASRTVEICLHKRPADYKFHDWPEGGIEEHLAAHSTEYLGAVFALVAAWAKAGRPPGRNLTGFRFAQWERACSWILENCVDGVPLLDAQHGEAQVRLADPDYDLLRSVFRLAVEGESRCEWTASGLAQLAAESGLLEGTEEVNRFRLGKALKRRFPEDGEYPFDGSEFSVTRRTRDNAAQSHAIAFYTINAKVGV
jgi:hypothetical protein